jgi:hypothetical protein
VSTLEYNPDTNRSYLIRAESSNIVFTPINKAPNTRNFYLLETKEKFKFSEEEQKFVTAGVIGILYLKKGEIKQKLRGFRTPTLAHMLERVRSTIAEDYLRAS